jgi:hypothetical protein
MSKINFKEAQELNQNFVKTRTKSIDIAIGKKDAISCWFSLDEIKNYISYVEEQAELKNLNVNGLRVYFGAYSNSIKNVSKKGLATVFFVPTQVKIKSDIDGGDENSDIIDIDALNDGQVGDPPSAEYPQ